MDLMDLVMNKPAYNELISFSQISNPNPDPNSWCSRYEFRCSDCGLKYYVYFDHDFQDGNCTRGYCGHIAQG